MVGRGTILNEASTIHPTSALIRRAVEGDRQAMRELVAEVTPIIRASVGWVLSRGRTPSRREPGQEVEDVTQTVLLALFSDRGHALTQWDPARGLDLAGFVAMLAKRETVSLLRSRRRSPWTEDPTLQEDLDLNAVPRMGPESEAISRDMLAQLHEAVRERMSARGAQLFDLLFLRGLPTEEVCNITHLSADAVYAWRSRLARQVREILAELGSGPSTFPPPPMPPRPPPSGSGRKTPTTPARGLPVTRKAKPRAEPSSSNPPPPSEG
jgi:RNA polymerase sigma-70 factor (ECF subfamily)